MNQIDYLVVGHISRDIVGDSSQTGGTAVFSGRVAKILGCQTAVLTSTAPDFDAGCELSGISVHQVEAEATTTFENVYTAHGRRQTLHASAAPLRASDIPSALRRPVIVHLAPIANEVDPQMVHAFSNSLIGLTPQGWLRRWDEQGRVYGTDWPAAPEVLPLAAAVILSQEDLLNQEMLDHYRQWSRLLILTQGSAGCTVFFGDEARRVPAPRVVEVEATGAGDIFAAAFFYRLHQTAGNPWEAARFANQLAALSVTQADFAQKIERIQGFLVEQ
jgi:sugar/nucleoside kinase (ribokinase family)